MTSSIDSTYSKNKKWYATQFNFVNPTLSPYVIDLFNGYTLSNIQTSASPIVPPSIVSSNISLTTVGSGCFNPLTNVMYVADGNNIRLLDCATNTISSTINGGTSTFLFGAYNPSSNFMYFTGVNGSNSIVSVINCYTNTIVSTITVLPYPTYEIAYSSTSNKMYVGYIGLSSNALTVINCNTNTISSNISTSTLLSNPSFLAYNPNANTIYVSGGVLGGKILVINCNNDTIIDSIVTGTVNGGIVYNPTSNSIYLSSDYGAATEYVKIIDCDTNAITSSITLGFGFVGLNLTYNSLSNLVYVNNLGTNNITVIDCVTNTITSTIGGTFQSTYSVFVPKINTLYSSDALTNILYVLNSPSPQVFYVGGSSSYNEFLRELQNTPKRVGYISLLVDNVNQLSIPYEILKRDANGNQAIHVKLPNTYTSANQAQISVCELSFEPKELILDNTTILSSYTILPNTSVKMVIYYDEIDRSDILSDKIDYAKLIDVTVPDGNTKTEEQIEATEFRPLTKPQWLKNFKVAKKITV